MSLRIFKRSVMVEDNVVESIEEYNRIWDGLTAARARGTGPDIFVDIGASVGIFAVAMALQFPSARIYAVEPAPQNYRYLLWNLRENNLTGRVWPLNVAIVGRGSADKLTLRYSPIWPIASGYCPMEEQSQCEFIPFSAQAVSFDALRRNMAFGKVSWLKVDCEGCEWQLADTSGDAPAPSSHWTRCFS